MTAQVARDLRAAAEVLKRDGWTQGDYFDPESGCKCVSGAIAHVASQGRTPAPGRLDLDGEFDRWAAAAKVFRRVVQDDSIVNFNDTTGRTADEVIAALEAAADAAEREAGQ